MNLSRRRSSKVWTAQWYWRGKKFCRSTGMSNKRAAAAVAARFLDAQRKDRLDLLEGAKLRRTVPSIAQVLMLYVEHATCRPETVAGNVAQFRRAILWTKVPESSPVTVLNSAWPGEFSAAARSRGWSNGGVISALRQCRSIFTRRLLPRYGMQEPPAWLKLPNPKPDPTRGFQPIPWASWRQIVRGVIVARDPALYRAFVLMARCGMGNDEVIHARGTWLLPSMAIRVEPRAGWLPKSHNRHRTIPIRAARWRRHFLPLLGKDVLLVPDGHRRLYRVLNPIIRAALPGRQKAAYELRKQAGSVIATRDGMFAAGKFLGDRSSTAERYYAALLKPLRPI